MAKGSEFERQICKQLSLWWSNNKRDDIYWRTSNSGGRATVRAKKGGTTKGQYGDVCATDPIGQPLLDLITLELKRGYPKANLHDLLDRTERSAQGLFEKWINKAMVDSEKSGSAYWAIISRRNNRDALITMPWELFTKLEVLRNNALPQLKLKSREIVIGSTLLSDFFECVSPKMIRRLV
jgi:hypothetical protein